MPHRPGGRPLRAWKNGTRTNWCMRATEGLFSLFVINARNNRLLPCFHAQLHFFVSNILEKCTRSKTCSRRQQNKNLFNCFTSIVLFCQALRKQLADKPRLPALSFLLSVGRYLHRLVTSRIQCEGLMSAIHLLTALKSFSTRSCLGFLFFSFLFLLSLFPFLSASEKCLWVQIVQMLPPKNFLPYHLFIRFAVLYIFSQRESQRKVPAFIIPHGTGRFKRSQENIVSHK